jgi:hypothetical protein
MCFNAVIFYGSENRIYNSKKNDYTNINHNKFTLG